MGYEISIDSIQDMVRLQTRDGATRAERAEVMTETNTYNHRSLHIHRLWRKMNSFWDAILMKSYLYRM